MGLVAFPLFLIFKIELPPALLIAFIIPLVLDGGIQLIFCIMSNNIKRFLTGVLFSLGLLYLVKIMIQTIWTM